MFFKKKRCWGFVFLKRFQKASLKALLGQKNVGLRKSLFWVGSLVFAPTLGAKDLPGGWMWYEDPIKQEERLDQKSLSKKAPQETSPQKEAAPDVEALTPAERRSRALGRQFEAQIALSLENPTFDNVRQAQQLQREILARADRFQKLWQQVSLLDPDSHTPAENPNTAYRQIQKRLKAERLDQKLRALAKEWGLFFLFKKGCPYCDHFAPQVKSLEQTYGFEVKAVSRDGGRLALFPKAASDNGALAALNPRGIYPSLLLAHPKSGAVIPVSWGLTSRAQLLDNFEIILRTLEGDQG